MWVFVEFFFTFGRFPGTIDHLPIVLTEETSSFVKESDIMSPSLLYQNFSCGDTRGLVSVHFLAALNIYFGGNRAWSKDVMSEFFHNHSMKTLSISNNSIVLKFDAIKKLNKNINDLINSNIHLQKKEVLISEVQNLNPPTVASDELTFTNKIESIIVKEILNDKKHLTDFNDDDEDNDVSDIHPAKVAEKIEPEKDDFGEDLQKPIQANIHSDYEPAFNNVIGINDWAKIKENQEMRQSKLDREAQQVFDAEADLAIWESNPNDLPQMLASDEILKSTISEKIKELQVEQNKQFATKIEPKLDPYLRNGNDKTLCWCFS